MKCVVLALLACSAMANPVPQNTNYQLPQQSGVGTAQGAELPAPVVADDEAPRFPDPEGPRPGGFPETQRYPDATQGDKMLVTKVQQELPRVSEDEAELIVKSLGDGKMPPSHAFQALPEEKQNEIFQEVKAMNVAEVLADELIPSGAKVEEIAEEVGGLITQTDAEKISEMKKVLTGAGLTQTDAQILQAVNQEIQTDADDPAFPVPDEKKGSNSIGDSIKEIVADAEPPVAEAVVVETSGLVLDSAAPGAPAGQASDDVPDKTEVFTRDEKMAVVAIAAEPKLNNNEKGELIVEVMDGEILTEKEAEAVVSELSAMGKLDADTANLITALEDKSTVQIFEAEAASEPEKLAEAMENAAEKLGDADAVGEMAAGISPEVKAEVAKIAANDDSPPDVKALVQQALHKRPDTAPGNSEKELKAVAAVIADNDNVPEQEALAAKIIESPLTAPEQQEVARMVQQIEGKLDNKDLEIINDLGNQKTFDKLEKAEAVAAVADDVLPVETGPEGEPIITARQETPDTIITEPGQASDELVPENSVLHLMGLRMLRFMKSENKHEFLELMDKPEFIDFFTRLADSDNDGKISSQEWSHLYSDKLVNYWAQGIKSEIPVPMEEWMTVDLNKDGFISVKDELYPTLFDMPMEPIFRAIQSAVFYHFDADKNGLLDKTPSAEFAGKSEYDYWMSHALVAQVNAMPLANEEEVQAAVDTINKDAGPEEAEKVVNVLEQEGLIEPTEQAPAAAPAAIPAGVADDFGSENAAGVACRQRGIPRPGSSKCFQVFPLELVSYQDAVAACRAKGGVLATPGFANPRADLQAFAEALREAGGGAFAWIGLRQEGPSPDNRPDDFWVFTVQNSFGRPPAPLQSDWDRGQPDNYNGVDERCGAIRSNGFLNDAPCEQPFNYICEFF